MKINRILILGLLFVSISCSNKNLETLKSEVNLLRSKNDSLTAIVKEISNKFVFDSISFRDIPSKNNTGTLNSDYELELLVVGYNHDQSFFIKYDSIINNKMINPDTLIQKHGGFNYSTKFDKEENYIRIDMNISNKFGKSKTGRLVDKIRVKE